MTTPDRLLERMELPFPEFIKNDTQGYELEVLKGAAKALTAAEFVLLEACTRLFDVGAPLLPEVLAWMTDAGFAVWDVCGIHRLPDRTLCQMDLLFARESSPLFSSGKTLFPEWTVSGATARGPGTSN